MDYSAAITRLQTYEDHKQLMLIHEVADAFEVHTRTVESWLRRKRSAADPPTVMFPQPVRLMDAAMTARYWRPDELIAWAKQAADFLTIEQVCRMVGVKTPETIRKMVAQGKFPAPQKTPFFVGKGWPRAVVEDWLAAKTGGYRFNIDAETPATPAPKVMHAGA